MMKCKLCDKHFTHYPQWDKERKITKELSVCAVCITRVKHDFWIQRIQDEVKTASTKVEEK